jgi:hypothetical protein
MKPHDWVILRLPPDFVRRGQVVSVQGYSMTVRWLGDDRDRVLPWAGYYIEVGWLTAVEAPQSLPLVPEDASRLLEIAQAAAMLGITPKQVRAALRSGRLEGKRGDGARWRGVESRHVYAVLKSRSGRATD